QVANDIRMNTPTINVIPAHDGDIETAEVFKGIIKDIEYRSNADDVYDTASLNAIKCSIGFIRVDHDYVDDVSFDQELKICRVVNPLNCFIDANSVECDGRDAMHGIVLEKITVEEFKRKWPNKTVSCFEKGSKEFANAKDEDTLTIAEFY